MIAGDPTPTLEQIKAAMTDCQEFRIEIGGHTDRRARTGSMPICRANGRRRSLRR
ncbi:hypothetical protein [Paracoccus cavernae]|uniref:hypothetical protein n=1 Tax=Paracoccus cavernae TaxID=1571207 RepID=UPI0036323586